MLFALATLAVIGVIAVLFIGNFRQSQRDSIVLPDAAQSAQPAAQQPGEEPSLLEVSRSNVQNIKIGRQRPLALFFAADGGVGQNDRLRFKYKRLRALAHGDQLPVSICP